MTLPAMLPSAAQVPFAADLGPDSAALEAAVRLANTGYPTRAHQSALHILERARAGANRRLIAAATACLASTSRMLNRFETGIGFAREARSLFEVQGDLACAAGAGGNLAWILASIGEQDAIVEALKTLDQAERSGDPTQTILALDTNAIVLWLLRQCDQALPFAERAEQLSRLHQPRLKRPLINLAGIRAEIALHSAAGQGEIDEPAFLRTAGVEARPEIEGAIALTTEALGLCRADGDGWIERICLCNIAEYRLHLGDADAAERALQTLAEAGGEDNARSTSHYLHMLGRTRARQGRFGDAIAALTQCQEITLASGDLETASPCHKDLADLQAHIGDHRAALQAFRAYHDLYVRQASHAAQRRARIHTLEWEAVRLRGSVKAALAQAADLTATNRVLAQETERLLRASMEDPLTGLPNRRRLDLAFVELVAAQAPYVIAVIDVDRFKQVNDQFTHSIGDATLRSIAGLLRQCARAQDLVVRFGGDEFALLLQAADLATAAAICRRLCHSARTHAWSALHPDLHVTLSIGVAASHEAETRENVFALADRRLYQAKQTGRDRVIG